MRSNVRMMPAAVLAAFFFVGSSFGIAIASDKCKEPCGDTAPKKVASVAPKKAAPAAPKEVVPAAAPGCGADDGHGHAAEAEKSDLDRSVAELMAMACEHKMPMHQCDECRYETGVVKVPPAFLSTDGKTGLIAVSQAKRTSFGSTRSFSGEVALNESRTLHATAPQAGTVRAVFVEVGATVAVGAPLFEIDSHDVAEAKADLLKKTAMRDLARKTVERETRLFEKKISAEVEVLEAKARLADAEIDVSNAVGRLRRLGVADADIRSGSGATDESMGRLVVHSPQAGTVLERHAVVGERVEAGKEMLLLSDLTEVRVFATLREGDAKALAKSAGSDADVRSSDGKTYRGRFEGVSGRMDEKTRTLQGRLTVSNPDGGLRPGMFVSVNLRMPGGGSGVAVPKTAVLADAGRSFVFVWQKDDYWIRRPVNTGRAAGDQIELVKGVSAGTKVIANGSFLLKSDVLRGKMGAGCAD